MNKILILITALLISFFNVVYAQTDECNAIKKMSFDEIRALIVKASIVHYQGTVSNICACPFSFDTVSNTYCGANSAYYKNPTAGLKCFPKDVSFVDVANYKAVVCGNNSSGDDKNQPQENGNNIDSPQN